MQRASRKILPWRIRWSESAILPAFVLLMFHFLNDARSATGSEPIFSTTARPGSWITFMDGSFFGTATNYSPDGNWIVITSEQGGRNDEAPLLQFNPQSYGEIYAIRIADRKLVRLTNNKREDGTSSWMGPVE